MRDYRAPPLPGEVLLISLGGSCQFYVPGHDGAVVRKIVELLQASDFAGPIFTREAVPGTFPHSAARIDSPDSADVLFSFRWSEEKNRWGVAGSLGTEGKNGGFGTHASLSRFDVHNTLIAAGPDIRAGFVDELPTGNVDVAPTIFHLLGITPPEPQDGRVLFEALTGASEDPPKTETETIEATTTTGDRTWRQYLKITTLGNHTYLDEGNAGHAP